MRRALLGLLACLFFLWGYADDYVTSSGELTSDQAVLSVPGYFYGATITTDSSNDCTLTLYDNASAASGKKIVSDLKVDATTTQPTWAHEEDPPIGLENGIYADVTCAGTCKFTILYRRQ